MRHPRASATPTGGSPSVWSSTRQPRPRRAMLVAHTKPGPPLVLFRNKSYATCYCYVVNSKAVTIPMVGCEDHVVHIGAIETDNVKTTPETLAGRNPQLLAKNSRSCSSSHFTSSLLSPGPPAQCPQILGNTFNVPTPGDMFCTSISESSGGK